MSLQKRLDYMKERKRKNIETYNKNPKKCKYCCNALPYEKRYLTYCNHSCAATHTNMGKPHNPNGNNKYGYNEGYKCNQTKCSYCGGDLNTIRRTIKGKPTFCCKAHQKLYYVEQQINENKPIHSVTLKYYLIQTRGYKCEECGLTEWCRKPIPLESHHIDGDVTNNKNENLKLLCKNCHGLTDNYGVRNLGKSTRYKNRNSIGRIAQSVERPAHNRERIGSNPIVPISTGGAAAASKPSKLVARVQSPSSALR